MPAGSCSRTEPESMSVNTGDWLFSSFTWGIVVRIVVEVVVVVRMMRIVMVVIGHRDGASW